MKKQWYGVKLLYRYKIKDQPGGAGVQDAV